MLFLDRDEDEIVIAKPPARYNLPKEMKEFAYNWLHTVNVLQDGDIKPKDLKQINLN